MVQPWATCRDSQATAEYVVTALRNAQRNGWSAVVGEVRTHPKDAGYKSKGVGCHNHGAQLEGQGGLRQSFTASAGGLAIGEGGLEFLILPSLPPGCWNQTYYWAWNPGFAYAKQAF